MKRVALIVVVLLVLASIVGGIVFLHVRSKSGTRPLINAGLALRAEKFDRAVDLATEYVEKNPQDWRGYDTLSRAYVAQGEYDRAREVLLEAKKVLDTVPVEIDLQMADSYSMPGRKRLSTLHTSAVRNRFVTVDPNEVNAALAELKEGTRRLQELTVDDPNELDKKQIALARNWLYASLAHEMKFRRLEAQAEVARAGGAADRADAIEQSAVPQARARRNAAWVVTLLNCHKVLQSNPSHEFAAETLVDLTVSDAKGEQVRAVLAEVPGPQAPDPRVQDWKQRYPELVDFRRELVTLDPLEDALELFEGVDPGQLPSAAYGRLLIESLRRRLGGMTTEQRARASEKVGDQLETLIAANPDNTEVKILRASLAMTRDNLDKAKALIDEVVAEDADNLRASLIHAQILHLQGHHEQAEQELFELQSQQGRRSPEVLYWYGLVVGRDRPPGEDQQEEQGKRVAMGVMREVLDENMAPAHLRARQWVIQRLREKDVKPRAFEEARTLLRQYPGHPYAVRTVAELSRQLDRIADGQEDLRRALRQALESGQATPAVLSDIAQGLATIGDEQAAKDVYEQLAAMDPASPLDRLVVAQAMQELGRASEAEKRLRQEVQRDPNNPAAHFMMGRFYERVAPMEALEHYRTAVELRPGSAEFRTALARAYYRLGNFQECADQLEQVEQMGLEDNKARLLRMELRLAMGESIDRVVATSDKSELRGVPLASMYLRNSRPDKAREVCEKVLQRNPSNESARNLLGQAQLQMGNWDQAIEQYQSLLRSNPEEPHRYYLLARVLWARNQGRPDAQQSDIRNVLRSVTGAQHPLVELALGQLALANSQMDQCRRALEPIVRNMDVEPAIRLRATALLATCEAQAGNAQQCLAHLKVLSQSPAWRKDALLRTAEMYVALRQPLQAQQALDRALDEADRTRDTSMLRRIAILLIRMGQNDQALEMCERYEQYRPGEPAADMLRGDLLMMINQRDQARQAYREVLDNQPRALAVYPKLARLHEADGRLNEALSVLDAMAEVSETGRTVALWQRSRLLQRWGLSRQAVDALEQLEQAMSEHVSPQVRLALAQSYVNQSMKDRARDQLELIPRHDDAYVMAQVMLARLADEPDARLGRLRAVAGELADNPTAQAGLMEALLETDRADEAFRTWQAFSRGRDAPAPDALRQLAVRAALDSGQTGEAVRLAGEAMHDIRGYRSVAALLTLRDDPERAAQVLPLPEQAHMREALLGVCAAHVRGRAGDASRWNEAVQQMQGRARNEMSPTGRAVGLPLAAAVARNGELLQQMADQMASSETLWAEALGDMVDRYKADPNATADEAAVLLEGLVAMDMQLETMARERAMEVLDRRPASMIAATLAMSTDPNEATAGRILSKMDPPDSATALRLRAAQLAKHSQYEQAAELYRQASDKAGQPVALRLQEAIVLEKAGKYPQALTLYQQLWQRHQLPVAGNNAANLVAKLYPDDPARLAEALEWADQLVRQSPGNPIYLDTRGWLSLLTGNQQQALTDLRQAVRGLRGWAQVHYHAGLAERATGDPTVATWQFQAAVDSYQRRKALDEPLPPEEVQAAELARKELAEEG